MPGIIGCLCVVGFTMPLLLGVACQSSLRLMRQPLVMNQFKKPVERAEKPRPDPGIAAYRQPSQRGVTASTTERPIPAAKQPGEPPKKLVVRWKVVPNLVVSRQARYDRALKATREAIGRLTITRPVLADKYAKQLNRYIKIITDRGILWKSRYQTEAIDTKFKTIRRNVLTAGANPDEGRSKVHFGRSK